MKKTVFFIITSVVILGSCNRNTDALFEVHEGTELGIDFQNTITTNDTLNALTFEYIYNGSGVGVGDFNKDGLDDLFFGGNQVSSELYLNQGNMRFKKTTTESKLNTNRWITGVSVIDINTDTWPDLYLSVAGPRGSNMENLLFINKGLTNGIPVFEEQAAAYGLNDSSYSTMAAFFDYDRDGDNDMYLVNNWLESFNRNNLRPKRVNSEAESTDKLYRNNSNGTFTDVSSTAGITIEGYGLGINISDLNFDGWPDVYVANDFMSNDLIWINQKNGTFRNMASKYLKHQTHNGMGTDIADFNNDGLPDIVVVDMLPPGHERQKMMTPGQNYDHFHMSEALGYEPQYMRNTLQLNRGLSEDSIVRFSEIAFMAGVSRTDWSWAPLFTDFDNDGHKDLFIANGYRKDVTNLDFIFFGLQQASPFGTPEKRKQKFDKELENLNDVKISNYFFRNTGSLKFDDKTKAWGAEVATFSNGAVYVDLDNDGDQDLVTSNIDQPSTIYENLSAQKNENHYIRLTSSNPSDFNQKISIYTKGVKQFQEVTPYRGFQSSVMNVTHFGVGKNTKVDSIEIFWPDNKTLVLKDIPVDTLIQYSKSEAVAPKKIHLELLPPTLLSRIPMTPAVHKESSAPEIKVTRTLLHELSRYGPCLAAGDVNADGLDDFFVGGEIGQAAKLFIRKRSGDFAITTLPIDSTHEDGGATFFDADGDRDLDLYVAMHHGAAQEQNVHKVFMNDGGGNFSLAEGMIPEIRSIASCIASSDFDGDGDTDLFIAGRIQSSKYPESPKSFLLENRNGKYTDVTESVSKDLVRPGMISSAAWADVDGNRKLDLIIAGEWMPIRIFLNEGNHFAEATAKFGLSNLTGWWNCIEVADVNRDGFPDIIGGNTGTNSFFEPTSEHPVKLIAKDFDDNGSIDPLIAYYNPVEDDYFLVHNRLVLLDQIPRLKKRFETFHQFATTPFAKIFSQEELEGAIQLETKTLASIVLMNNKGESFTASPLPEHAQLSTINDMVTHDVNNDGHLDIIAIGNSYEQETLYGRYDASLGIVLLGNSTGTWKAVRNQASGLLAEKSAKAIVLLKTENGFETVITNNSGPVECYRLQHPTSFNPLASQ